MNAPMQPDAPDPKPSFVRALELPGTTKVEDFPLELTDEAKEELARKLAAIAESERQAAIHAHEVFIR